MRPRGGGSMRWSVLPQARTQMQQICQWMNWWTCDRHTHKHSRKQQATLFPARPATNSVATALSFWQDFSILLAFTDFEIHSNPSASQTISVVCERLEQSGTGPTLEPSAFQG